MTAPIPPRNPLLQPATPPVAPATVAAGPLVPAVDRIKLFGPTEWEEFVVEWAQSLTSHYAEVSRLGGAGDQGRDVIGVADDGSWDNYQCKHYAQPLAPSQVWTEIGKVIHYTHTGAFSCPRRFFFVAPRGVGTTLSNLFRRPARLRQGLLDNWDAHCATKITTTETLPLESSLREYIDAFDFSIFGTVAPHRLVDGHALTRWHVARFGGGLPHRPAPALPPDQPTTRETPYVRALLDAYADHLQCPVETLEDLPDGSSLNEHFADARREFYCAEALRAFSRDTLPPGSFKELQDQIYSGIGDDLRDDHEDGYRRVRVVVKAARTLALDGHALNTSMAPRDRGGICHQLANDGTIPAWVK